MPRIVSSDRSPEEDRWRTSRRSSPRSRRGETLSRDEAREAFDIIMSGEATPAQIGAFLTGLRVRGETVDEIAGAVATMRAKMTPVEAPADAIDVVGTGGDASGSYNISTAAAFVVAGAGVPVAKHGNRALSSKSGAADTLAALGVNIDLTPDQIAPCIREAGIGFMFAPAHHAAMKHVGPVRAELGFRTVFNLIGPLSNPASVKRYLLGVYSPDWVEPLANVLASLGAERAWVVHGAGGLDEISPAGRNHGRLARRRQGHASSPSARRMPGCRPRPPRRSRAATPSHNAEALRQVLDGAPGAYRDTVLLNAGAALVVAGLAKDLAEGVELAAEVDRQRQGARAAGQARRGIERLGHDRHPRNDRSQQARRDRRREGSRAAGRDGAPRPAPPLAARLRQGAAGNDRRRPAGADRRDQEGEPVEGADPRRFRSAGAGARLSRPAARPACRC